MSENVIKPLLIEAHYMPSIAWMKTITGHEQVVLDTASNFVKASYRNRAHVLGANGQLTLSVPLASGRSQRSTMGDIVISYDENWQKNHWMTIVSCYRRSAYFEFFEDSFALFYEQRFNTLMELNMAAVTLICKLLKIPVQFTFTENYIPEGTTDYLDLRNQIMPRNLAPLNLTFKPYMQVFSDRFPFHENLSILDALFNQGRVNLNEL